MRQTRRKRFWRILSITLPVLLLFLLSPAWLAQRASDAESARAKAEHIPLTYAEIYPGPPVDAENNSFADYASAAQVFALPNYNSAKFGTPEYWEKAESDFTANRAALDRFFIGAAKPFCQPTRPTDLSSAELGNEFPNLSALGRTLGAESLRRCWLGYPGGALKLLQPLPPAARNISKLGSDLALLEGWGFEHRAVRSVADVLDLRGVEPDVAEIAAELLKDPSPTPDPELAVELSAIHQLEILKDPATFRAKVRESIKAKQDLVGALSSVTGSTPPATDPMELPIRLSYIPWMVPRWRTQRLRLLIETVETIRLDKGNPTHAESDYKKIDEDEAKGKYGLLPQIGGGGGLQYLLPTSDYFENDRRVVLQGAEILRIWRTTHALPKELPLAGELALDAHLKKPLRYQRSQAGFKVWAADRWGQDHGGTIQDTLFEYPSSNPTRRPLPPTSK